MPVGDPAAHKLAYTSGQTIMPEHEGLLKEMPPASNKKFIAPETK